MENDIQGFGGDEWLVVPFTELQNKKKEISGREGKIRF